MNRSDILERIKSERERQLDLPGSELDANNTVNDWIAIAGYYLSQEARRATTIQTRQSDFESELIKAAAVIVAALEHSENMKDKGELS
jgi:hypothetical protein